MRAFAAAFPLALAVLLAGCSGGSPTQSTEGSADDSAAMMSPPSATEDAAPDDLAPVTDEVAFSGIIGAGACAFDGSSIQCANLPSLTPPSTSGSNVLLYHHPRAAAFTGGLLDVAWSPHVGLGLSASVSIYAGCPDDCEFVEELADGRSSLEDTGVSTDAGFTVEVPARELLEGQTLGVRIAPILATTLASAHTGYDVDLTGSLAFVVPA